MVLMRLLVGLVLQVVQLGLQRGAALHGFEDLRAAQLVPRGGDDGGDGVLLAQQRDAGRELILAHAAGAGENDGAGVLHLIVEELAEVLHIHFALRRVHDRGEAVERQRVGVHALYGADHVGQLADAGRLDQNAVGVELVEHLLERLGEVAHQTAADAAGVHLVDLYAGVLQKAAVNGDLAELVFDQHNLFALIGLRDQLFDERGLAGAEKARKDINFCHT